MPIDILYLRNQSYSTETLRSSESLRGRAHLNTVDAAIDKDTQWRSVLEQCQSLRSQRKLLTKGICDKLKSNRKDEAQDDIAMSKVIGGAIKKMDKGLQEAKVQLDKALLNCGNPILLPMYTNTVMTTLPPCTTVRHTLNTNNCFITSLVHHCASYLTQHDFLAVELSQQQRKGLDHQQCKGILLPSYSSVWIPDSVLPLKYVLFNHNTNNLELTVLCPTEESVAKTFVHTVEMLSTFMHTTCSQWNVHPTNVTALPLAAVQQMTFFDSTKSQPVVQCYNFTDYHSRALEVRCGHGKGHGPVGGMKRYVHQVQCVVSMDALAHCIDANTAQQLTTQQDNSTALFVPLVVIKTGGNNPQKKQKKRKKSAQSSSSSTTTIATLSSSTVAVSSVPPTPSAQIVKLCTKTGVEKLGAIFSRQSFLCGKGWVASLEDVVVFDKLTSYLNYIAQVETNRFINMLKELQHVIACAREKEHTVPTWDQEVANNVMALLAIKNQMAVHGALCLETIVTSSCRMLKLTLNTLKTAGILVKGKALPATSKITMSDLKTHAPSETTAWFVGQRSFWRWYRCLNTMTTNERKTLLPTLEHLKSGRVSMLFDL